jgi:hypothetical protein
VFGLSFLLAAYERGVHRRMCGDGRGRRGFREVLMCSRDSDAVKHGMTVVLKNERRRSDKSMP